MATADTTQFPVHGDKGYVQPEEDGSPKRLSTAQLLIHLDRIEKALGSAGVAFASLGSAQPRAVPEILTNIAMYGDTVAKTARRLLAANE